MKSIFFSIVVVVSVGISHVSANPTLRMTASPVIMERQTTTPICHGGENSTLLTIVEPVPGTTVTQTQGNYDGASFEVLYCSGDYFKTRSLSLTVGLARPGSETDSGLILALGYGPSDTGVDVVQPGFSAYRFNVTVFPFNGNYISGEWILSVFEVSTGYYNAYNYHVQTRSINFEVI